MIATDDPAIEQLFLDLRRRVAAQGVEAWLSEKAAAPSRESLVYLCKFAYFTAIVTKAEIGRLLRLERPELKALIRSWYDDHRARGCGTC